MSQYDIDIRFTSSNVSPFLTYNQSLLIALTRDLKQGDLVDRKDNQSKEKMITHAWKLLGEELIKYRGHRILVTAMSCCLRSLFNSLERVRTTDGFSRTDGYNEYMMGLSSALSVLFTTLKGCYQHPKAIISAFVNVQ